MNKKYCPLLWVIPALLFYNLANAQISSKDTLKVVNWNIEWFGSNSGGPADNNLQEANVKTVIQNLNADVYAFVEVVDVTRLQNIVNSMPGYSFIVSDFCSGGSSVSSCASAQKLAFVYRTSKVNKIKSYAVLKAGGSANASYNWASGRFPFLMEADVILNNAMSRFLFTVIHAKANTGTTSEKIIAYNRRRDGIAELRDSFNTQYPTANFILSGDYNDDLDKTITTEILPETTSSYNPVLTQPDKYIPVTLPLSLAAQNSTAFFPDVIDHVTLSNEMNNYYVANSAKIMKTEVESWVANYSTTTSDHYPVQTKYYFDVTNATPIVTTGINSIRDSKESFAIQSINHSGFNLDVYITDISRNWLGIRLMDLDGRILKQQTLQTIAGLNKIEFNTSNLVLGIYLLQVNGKGRSLVQKVMLLK